MSVGDTYWYVAITHRFTEIVVRSHWGYTERLRWVSRSEVQRRLNEMLRKITAEEKQQRSTVRPEDATLQKQCPTVFEYLAADAYPDGEVRQRATMMVLMEADMVKLCLNDKDNERSLWISGTTLANALKALESAVNAPSTSWRPNRPQEQPMKKKSR